VKPKSGGGAGERGEAGGPKTAKAGKRCCLRNQEVNKGSSF